MIAEPFNDEQDNPAIKGLASSTMDASFE